MLRNYVRVYIWYNIQKNSCLSLRVILFTQTINSGKIIKMVTF